MEYSKELPLNYPDWFTFYMSVKRYENNRIIQVNKTDSLIYNSGLMPNRVTFANDYEFSYIKEMAFKELLEFRIESDKIENKFSIRELRRIADSLLFASSSNESLDLNIKVKRIQEVKIKSLKQLKEKGFNEFNYDNY